MTDQERIDLLEQRVDELEQIVAELRDQPDRNDRGLVGAHRAFVERLRSRKQEART